MNNKEVEYSSTLSVLSQSLFQIPYFIPFHKPFTMAADGLLFFILLLLRFKLAVIY
jgi:hypothetical protein